MSARAQVPAANSSDLRSRRSTRTERKAARRRAGLEAKLESAERLVAKRAAQLGSASARRAALAARLTHLSDTVGDAVGPMAYCLKDRRQVSIGGAHPVILASGRPAVAGTCPSCGMRVLRFVSA